MPRDHRREVRHAAVGAAKVVRSVPDGLEVARRASAVVCMGGYNTVCEVMSTNVPALVVPRVTARKEQMIRAEALAAQGLVHLCPGADLTPDRLSSWLAEHAGASVVRHGVDLDGLATVGTLASRLIDAVSIEEEAGRVAV
jgi:predicted glycosyltransferase